MIAQRFVITFEIVAALDDGQPEAEVAAKLRSGDVFGLGADGAHVAQSAIFDAYGDALDLIRFNGMFCQNFLECIDFRNNRATACVGFDARFQHVVVGAQCFGQFLDQSADIAWTFNRISEARH